MKSGGGSEAAPLRGAGDAAAHQRASRRGQHRLSRRPAGRRPPRARARRAPSRVRGGAPRGHARGRGAGRSTAATVRFARSVLSPDKTPQPVVPVRIEKRGPSGSRVTIGADDERRRRRVRRERRVDPWRLARATALQSSRCLSASAWTRARGGAPTRCHWPPLACDPARDDAPARNPMPSSSAVRRGAGGASEPSGRRARGSFVVRVRWPDRQLPADRQCGPTGQVATAKRISSAWARRAAGWRPRDLPVTSEYVFLNSRVGSAVADGPPVLPAVFQRGDRRQSSCSRSAAGAAGHLDRVARMASAHAEDGHVPGLVLADGLGFSATLGAFGAALSRPASTGAARRRGTGATV